MCEGNGGAGIKDREGESQRERAREGGCRERERKKKLSSKVSEELSLWARRGYTAWTQPQRLCNAAPQRTSIQLCDQPFQFSSLGSTMYSPYCLTQVWERKGKKICRSLRCSPLLFSGVLSLVCSYCRLCGYSVVLCCVAAACHLLRIKELFTPSLLPNAALFLRVVFNFPVRLSLSLLLGCISWHSSSGLILARLIAHGLERKWRFSQIYFILNGGSEGKGEEGGGVLQTPLG